MIKDATGSKATQEYKQQTTVSVRNILMLITVLWSHDTTGLFLGNAH